LAENGDPRQRVVITGIGMIASVGRDREAVWGAVRQGQSGVRLLRGVKAIPDDLLVAAQVDICPDRPGRLKPISLCMPAAAEAVADSGLDLEAYDPYRCGAAISGHMGDTDFVVERCGRAELIEPGKPPWWGQWYPCSACSFVANHYRLYGPRISHSTACSSGLIDILAAVRAIRDGRCDRALAGSAEAIHPLFAAGFHRMGVLAYDADDPTRACRPFDRNRSGFVMGEGAAMFVFERLDLARDRGAKIYAEILGGHILATAHHVTGLDVDSDALVELIRITLRRSGLPPEAIDYINAHGTGTQQNDLLEARSIRRAFGAAADRVCVSSTKSMLGHLVNASGSVELAVTTLALRDRFVPPTRNLTDPDPQCRIDCIPNVGRPLHAEHALKLSVAFGGHLAALAIRRWPDADSGRAARKG
jgi:3-oxoacyl-(acyl-carrier-protein) synthase